MVLKPIAQLRISRFRVADSRNGLSSYQVCFHVVGNDVAITLAAEAGQLQLNAIMPVIVLKMFESASYLPTAVETLSSLCVNGIKADESACARPLESAVARTTALVPLIGYEAAAAVAKLVDGGLSLDAAVRQVQHDIG